MCSCGGDKMWNACVYVLREAVRNYTFELIKTKRMKQEGLNMTRKKPTKRWKDLLAKEVLFISP